MTEQSLYRNQLPQLHGETMLTDGGLETSLVFHDGFDLPEFASFPLLDDERGRAALTAQYGAYVDVAREQGVGIVLETPTWRANADRGAVLGYDAAALERVNRDAVEFIAGLRESHGGPDTKVVVSGNIGPRGDGYEAGDQMTASEAEAYHQTQIDTFASAPTDLVSTLTMTYVAEAIGISRAAINADIPVAVSFTVETDGRLPTGQPLGAAIDEVERATGSAPIYYGINCAHPTHFTSVLRTDEDWVGRIGWLRTNASAMSHEELDNAEELDDGDPAELAAQHRELFSLLPGLRVVGGCCGTDHRHVDAIGRARFAPAVS